MPSLCEEDIENYTTRRLYSAITDSDNKLLLLAGEQAIWMVRPSKIKLEASILMGEGLHTQPLQQISKELRGSSSE